MLLNKVFPFSWTINYPVILLSCYPVILHQLVNVPIHQPGHTLDWLITNRATDVLNLTVVDMLLSDHFVISFDLLLKKPVREKRKIISRNIRAIDMHDFRTDVHNLLGSATQSNSTDPLGVYNTCLRQLLDHHALLIIMILFL